MRGFAAQPLRQDAFCLAPNRWCRQGSRRPCTGLRRLPAGDRRHYSRVRQPTGPPARSIVKNCINVKFT